MSFLSFYAIANSQTYSSAGTYTYTVPAGVTSITIYCWGAGGGSGGCVAGGKDQAGGGGGGGACTKNIFTVTPGQSLTIVVGAGGTAGSSAGTNGGLGGTSSVTGIGVSITAAGGSGGNGVTTNGGAGTGGAGGSTGSGYSVIYSGGNGSTGVRSTSKEVGGAGGGGAGSGGAGGNGIPGTVTGGGSNSTGGTGGAGTYPGGNGAGAIVSDGSFPGVAGNGPGGGAAGAATYATANPGAVGGDGQVAILLSCTAPLAPNSLNLTPSVVNITGAFTAPVTPPSGYLVVRTTTSTAPTTPATGTTYTAGTSALGGYIVSVGSATSFNDVGLSVSTQYWYWVYSYNNTSCFGGPAYSATKLSGNVTTSAICGGSYSIYALDDQGYVYPVNTSTAALQTPLNYTVGPISGANAANALGYDPTNSLFYFLSSTSGTFVSYDGVSTYNSSLPTPFSGSSYPVVGTGTALSNGFYAITWNDGALYYYSALTNTWTKVATTINSGATNLSAAISGSYQNGDLIEDAFGRLWILMSSSNKWGLYFITAPPTTSVGTVNAAQVVAIGAPLPVSATASFNGAAFDSAGNLFISNINQLYMIPKGSTTPNLIGTFSGLQPTSWSIRDLAQCSYTLYPLPVVWSYFYANPQNEKVNLSWGVAQASNVMGFYVERSNDSKNWDTLGFVQYASGTMNYSLVDASPAGGVNYYRISEKDFDGNSKYSDIREIEIPLSTNISVWPNPANDVVHIQYNRNSNSAVALIYDVTGRLVLQASIYGGNNSISISNLSEGVYFLVLKEGNENVFSTKIIKRKN
ncbi:MAG: T9SS type A sorting domain-containing protein [Bacteroidetes bacterium]|nr:T9SS type A sorting domain-containing protein [Bacteroidota bacterium]MBS1974855.1 T9SS type A sorting domain-containing protein [Bacteroidota bacterium]